MGRSGDEDGRKDRKKGKDEKVAFYKLFSFADKKDYVLMSAGVIGAIANGLSMPLMTFILADLINAFGRSTTNDVVHRVSKVCLEFVYLAVGAGVASFIQVAFWMITGERQAARIRGLYLQTILRQDIAFFDTQANTGEVIGRMSGDTVLIQDAIGEKVGKFVQLLSTFVGGFVIAFTRGWLLSLVMMSSIVPIVIAGAVLSLTISKLSSRAQESYSEAGIVVEQTIGSIRTVVSFTGEKKSIRKYNKLINAAYESAVHTGTALGLGTGIVLLIIFGSYGLAVYYGSKLIIENGYNGGSVFNIMVAVMTSGMSLGQTSPCLTAFASGQTAAFKMFQTIHRKPEIDSYATDGIVLEEVKGDIELKDVSFSYPARPNQLLFDHFSLYIPSGTTMALVGESGSGKSSVISLVERFYDPQSGEVLIDGVNLKKLRLKWIREQIGLVSQEPILFTTTIRENIAYGKEGATPGEVKRAIELANAAKFIDKMPKGLDTMVGEHGTQLSGGQKQRIGIARAILKNPKILLLDEATSALDAESERIVQEALERIMVNRTTIVVAHRLSTIKNADTISVVHRGKVVEQGSHMELIKNPEGPYSQLIRLQELQKQEPEANQSDMSNLQTADYLHQGATDSTTFRHSTSRSSSNRGSRRSSFGTSGLIGSQEEGQRGDRIAELENKNDKMKQVSIKRLAYLNKPELPIILLGSASATINGAIFPIFGLLLSSVIKIFYEPPQLLRKHSKFWAGMFALLGLGSFIFCTIQRYLFGVAGGKLIQRIRSLSFEKIVYQEISWFDEPAHSSGAIGARLSTDASTVHTLVGDTLALWVQNTVTVIVGVVIAFVANWKLAFIVLMAIPLTGLQGYFQMKLLQGFSADAKKMYEEASQVANDAVGSIRTVASFCAEKKVMEAYSKKCEGPVKHAMRQGIISGLGYGISFLIFYLTYAFCFYIGALFVHNGNATFGQVFKVFFALTMAALGVSQSSAIGPDANKAKDSAASIFDIIDRKSKIDSSINEGETLAEVKGEIEFLHIGFRYPTRPDVQIFKDLCLRIPSGKTVALVGESGSGKSTAISLLQRFYDPDTGTITIDGIEIRRFNISWLRQQMGLVSQEPALFNDTLRANIAYGKQGEVTEEEIIAAAKASNAHEFISGMREGYDTNVGERGVQLSGGQKQRIAIARAILKDPRILLLDEATSALDAESERVVQEALENVMVGRTTVVVAHRLSTIKGADIIAVVKNGVVAEKGRHEILMQIPNGAYASLVSLQASNAG